MTTNADKHWIATSLDVLWRDACRAGRALATGAVLRAARYLPLAVALLGCTGSQYTVARKTLAPVGAAAVALHQEWQIFDAERGRAIIKNDISAGAAPQKIRDDLAMWTAAGDKVEQAFALLVQKLHAAKAAVDAAEAGAAGALPVPQILAGLAADARALVIVLRLSGVKSPALDAFQALLAVGGP